MRYKFGNHLRRPVQTGHITVTDGKASFEILASADGGGGGFEPSLGTCFKISESVRRIVCCGAASGGGGVGWVNTCGGGKNGSGAGGSEIGASVCGGAGTGGGGGGAGGAGVSDGATTTGMGRTNRGVASAIGSSGSVIHRPKHKAISCGVMSCQLSRVQRFCFTRNDAICVLNVCNHQMH